MSGFDTDWARKDESESEVQVALSFDFTYYRQLRGEHAMICAWPEINGEAIK